MDYSNDSFGYYEDVIFNISSNESTDPDAHVESHHIVINKVMLQLGAVVKWLNLVGIPVICMVGIFANTLCVLAYWRTRLRVQSSSVYLVCLAAVDTCFLIRLFVIWLDFIGMISIHHRGICEISAYLTYVFTCVSVWILVAFTTERFIIVYYPYQRLLLCTKRRAQMIVLGITLIACVFYTLAFKATGVIDIDGSKRCVPLSDQETLTHIIVYTDAIVTLLIPCVAMIGLNIAIAYKVRHFICLNSRKIPYCHDNFMPDEDVRPVHVCCDQCIATCTGSNIVKVTKTSMAASAAEKKKMNETLRQDFHLRTTRSLLIASVVFLALNVPTHVFKLTALVIFVFKPSFEPSYNFLILRYLFTFLFYFNFSTNCLLYWVCNRSSRSALRRLFRVDSMNTKNLRQRLRLLDKPAYSKRVEMRKQTSTCSAVSSDKMSSVTETSFLCL